MNVKIKDLMVHQVVTTQGHKSIGHVKDIMKKNKIKSVPIVDKYHYLQGIVTATDLLGKEDKSPVSKVMVKELITIPLYSEVSLAARMMRKRKIHHLLVIDEKKLVGVISSFDLLSLIEKKRFELKNPSSPNNKRKSTRGIPEG